MRHGRMATAVTAGLIWAVGMPAAMADGTPVATPAPVDGSEPVATQAPVPDVSPTGALDAPVPNGVPVAQPDAVTTVPGQALVVPVLANDSDPDGDVLVVTGVSAAVSGATALVPDGVSYSPSPGFEGTDAFSYDVSDGRGGTASAVVTVTVSAGRVAALTTAGTVVALHRYVFRGTAGSSLGAPVRATLQRLTGTRWVTQAAGPAAADGSLAFTVTPTTLGAASWRVVAFWADGQAAVSASQTITTVARVDIAVSGPLTRADVPRSYRAGCPVPPSQLRRMTLTYWDYSGTLRRGQLIVRRTAVADLSYVFTKAFAARFRFKQIVPTDAFYASGKRSPTASDVAAMEADNTSAFNCRTVTGNPYRMSQHSYGNAIDINTVRNPYVVGRRVFPSFARSWLKRTPTRTGMIVRKGALAKAFAARGWLWGARWSSPDYQHFSSNGG